MNRTGTFESEKIGIAKRIKEIAHENKKEIIVAVLAFCAGKAQIADRQSAFSFALAVAAGGKMGVFAAVGAILSLCFSLSDINAVRFIAQITVAETVKWSFEPFFRKKGVFSLCALSALLNIGAGMLLLFAMEDSTVYDLLFLICETAICAGLTFFSYELLQFDDLKAAGASQNGRLGLCIYYCILLIFLSRVNVGFIYLGHIVGALFTLIFASRLGAGAGACAGLCTAVALSGSVSDGFLVLALALGGVLAGLFGGTHRFLVSLIFCVSAAGAFVLLSQDEQNVYILYELLSAAIIYLIVPDEVCESLGEIIKSSSGGKIGGTNYLTKKLYFAAECVNDAQRSFDELIDKMEKKNYNEIDGVYKKTADRVCRRCNMKLCCWDKFYQQTMDDFNALTAPLLKNGKVLSTAIPETLKKRCTKLPVLVADINSAYSQFASEKRSLQKIKELKDNANERLCSMSNLLCEMSNELTLTSCDDAMRDKALKAAEKKGLFVNDIFFLTDRLGRKSVEIYCNKDAITSEKAKALKAELSRVSNAEFATFEIMSSKQGDKVVFFEKTPFEVETDFFSLACEGESVCGDSFETANLQNGYFAAVLSDGMGKGRSAYNDSKITLALVIKFLKLGFDTENLISLVNSSLISKKENETLSTLDMAIFDLFGGSVSLKKAGAPASFVLRGKRVFKIEASSMPLGILPRIKPEKKEIRLQSGDMLVLASDGLFTLGDEKIEQIIKSHQTDASLSKRLCFAARAESAQTEQDDITVACITLK